MCRKFINEIRKKPKTIKDMSDRAQDVLTYFEINDMSSGVPIVEILRKMGFKVFQSNLEPSDLSAYIAVDPSFEDVFESNKITCVNVNDNIGHKRFALAHELAHYLFDFNEKEDLNYYNTYFPIKKDDSFEEDRANQFAANLLMPENTFRKKFKEYNAKSESKVDTVTSLVKYFLVSSTAVMKRINELNLS